MGCLIWLAASAAIGTVVLLALGVIQNNTPTVAQSVVALLIGMAITGVPFLLLVRRGRRR